MATPFPNRAQKPTSNAPIPPSLCINLGDEDAERKVADIGHRVSAIRPATPAERRPPMSRAVSPLIAMRFKPLQGEDFDVNVRNVRDPKSRRVGDKPESERTTTLQSERSAFVAAIDLTESKGTTSLQSECPMEVIDGTFEDEDTVFTVGSDITYRKKKKQVSVKPMEVIEEPMTPPPPTPPMIMPVTSQRNQRTLTRLENRDRDAVWFEFRKHDKDLTDIMIADGKHEPFYIGRHSDPALWCDRILANSARRANLPAWAHNATCIVRDEMSQNCCFQPIDEQKAAMEVLDEEKYSVDGDIPVIHAFKQSFVISKAGAILDAKTKRPVAPALAGAVKMQWEVERARNMPPISDESIAAMNAETPRSVGSVPRQRSPSPQVRDPDPQVVEQLIFDDEPDREEVKERPREVRVPTPRVFEQRAGEPEECPICREPMLHEQAHTIFGCGHRFHRDCADRLEQNRARHCPVCRAPLPNRVMAVIDPWAPEPVPEWNDDIIRAAEQAFMVGVQQVLGNPEAGDPEDVRRVAMALNAPFPQAPNPNQLMNANAYHQVGYWLSAPTLERMQQNGCRVQPGIRARPHPMMAAAKLTVLNYLWHHLGDRGYFVGGKASSVVNRGMMFHCNLFYSRPVDQIEFNVFRANACMCGFGNCMHLRAAGNRAMIPFTVMRPEVDLTILHNIAEQSGVTQFYVADLEIKSARGIVCPPDMEEKDLRAINRHQEVEANYSVNAAGRVTLQINADRHAFSYPYPTYQSRRSVKIVGTDVWYAVTKMMEHDGHAVYRFDQVVGPDRVLALQADDLQRDVEVPDLKTTIYQRTYIGPVNWNPEGDFKNPSNELRQLDIRMVYSFNDALVLGAEDALGTFVPKDVLCQAATDIMYIERNAQTMHMIKIKVKTLLEPLHMAAADKLNTLLVTVPLALTLTARDEEMVWNQHVSPLQPVLNAVKGLVNFQAPSLTQLLTSPLLSEWSSITRLRAAKAGDYIRRNPYHAAVIAVCLLLILATGLGLAMGPGEKPPPSTIDQIVERGGWLFKDISSKVAHYGSEAYAKTYPVCQSVWARKLGREPRCHAVIDGEVELIETYRYAFYLRAVERVAHVWFYFGLIWFEEIVKRLSKDGTPFGLVALLVLESSTKFMAGGFAAVLPIVIVGCLHVYLAKLPLFKAVFFHLLWNTTVITMYVDPVFYARVDTVLIPLLTMYALFQQGQPAAGIGAKGAIFGPANVSTTQNHKPIDEGAFIRPATKWAGPKRQAFAQMGPLVPGFLPNVSASCSDNLYRAVRTRHLAPKVPLTLTSAQIRANLREAMSMLPVPQGRTLHSGETAKFYRYRWLEWLSHYTPHQRQALEFGRRCVTILGFRSAWAKAHRVFTKVEKLMKQGADYAPRLVLTVTPQFSSVVGPYLYSLSKWFKNNYHCRKIIMYGPGQTVEAISSWIQMFWDAGYIFFDIDQSKCDSSYYKIVLETTSEIYKRMYCPKKVYSAIRLAYKKCKIYGNDGLVAAVYGTLVTGSNETTIGNTIKLIIVYIATALTYMTPAEKAEFKAQLACDFDPKGKLPLFGIIQAGDDAVMAVSPELLSRGYHPEDAREYGFRPTAKTGRFCDLEFLSGCFYPVNGTVKWGPKIGRQIPKIGADIDFEEKSVEKLRGVVLSMLQQSHHVPVLGAFIRRLEELTRGHAATPLKRNDDEWNPKSARCSNAADDTYAFVAERYGLCTVDLAACEQRISKMGLYDLINDPVINVMIKRDIR